MVRDALLGSIASHDRGQPMTRHRVLSAAAAVTFALGATVLFAPSASAQGAPIVWNQAVAVPSASSPCPVTTDVEKASGWTEWSSSWDTWPNGGKGGNVCNRSITWAHEAEGGPVTRCVFVGRYGGDSRDYWTLITGSYAYDPTAYWDAACTDAHGRLGLNLVYASSLGAADALCAMFLPSTPDARVLTTYGMNPYNPSVWGCDKW